MKRGLVQTYHAPFTLGQVPALFLGPILLVLVYFLRLPSAISSWTGPCPFTGQASKDQQCKHLICYPCVYTRAPAHSHTGEGARAHTQGSFKVSAIARRAEEADSEVVTSVIIVKARCAPPQFHPLSRTINLPLVPAAPEASSYRAAAAAMGNGRERRGGQKGGGGGEEDRRQLFLKSLSIL